MDWAYAIKDPINNGLLFMLHLSNEVSYRIDIIIGLQISDKVRIMIRQFFRTLIPIVYCMKYLCLN